MDNLPLKHREILIRYGRLAPHARDRVLDQFYLIVPGSMSLQNYVMTQLVALVAGSVAMTLFLSAFFVAIGQSETIAPGLFTCLCLEGTWVVWMMRRNYAKRYNEKIWELTELGLTKESIIFHHRAIHGGFVLGAMNWRDITAVEFIENVREKRNGEFRDCLQLSDCNGQTKRLFLDCLQTIEERKILQAFIVKYVKNIDTKKPLNALLRIGKEADVPFTKLWSQALRDSRPRTHTAPLTENSQLQNGRFVVKSLIGGGGQGAVYLCDANDLDEFQQVVLKEYVLPDLVHDAEHKSACEQFEKEVHLLSKLKNNGVIKLIDAFVEDHRAYLVLEHVRGKSLKEYVQAHGTLSPANVVALGLQMLNILEYLHSLTPAVMHLDFSPENLLLSPEGKLTVIDFNISAEENSIRTRTVMGKQRYMAPEQYRGKPSTKSDIYAFGATLYFLLTAMEPEPITVARTKKNAKDPDLVPDVLDELISRATNLEEENRFQNTQEVATALKKLACIAEKTVAPNADAKAINI